MTPSGLVQPRGGRLHVMDRRKKMFVGQSKVNFNRQRIAN
jgi:hypothetical protein